MFKYINKKMEELMDYGTCRPGNEIKKFRVLMKEKIGRTLEIRPYEVKFYRISWTDRIKVKINGCNYWEISEEEYESLQKI